MDTPGTPVLVNKHLRRVTALGASPLRRSLDVSLNSSFLAVHNDDNAERNKRRSEAAVQKRASLLPSFNSSFSSDSGQPVPSTAELKILFDKCLKMHADNKINVKNAWSLRIIDFFQAVLQTSTTKDVWQVGTMSLDMGTKIYGIRVDDVHSEGMKLASNLARSQAVQMPPNNDEEGEVAGDGDADNQKNSAGAKKKKKNRPSHTIFADPNVALAEFQKVESVRFQTVTNADESITDNFFTNKLTKDCSNCKFTTYSKICNNEQIVERKSPEPSTSGLQRSSFNKDPLINAEENNLNDDLDKELSFSDSSDSINNLTLECEPDSIVPPKPCISGNRIVELNYVLNWACSLQYEHSKICTMGKLSVVDEIRRGKDSKPWVNYNMVDYTITGNKKFTSELQSFANVVICPEFANFDLDEWDPDKESCENSLQLDEPLLDDRGLPIAELDGSVHDVFENNQDNFSPADGAISEDEDLIANEMAIRGSVAEICDLRPDGTTPGDYLYRSLDSSQHIANLWAGPSHWKLKHLNSARSVFSGFAENVPKQLRKRSRLEADPLNFDGELSPISEVMYKPRPLRVATKEKIFLPDFKATFTHDCDYLLGKDIRISKLRNPEKSASGNQELAVSRYDYENPNDSMYCAQNAVNDDDDDDDVPATQGSQMDEANFCGDNLIPMPDLVTKSTIGYATRAKKMDMKKLKNACWKTLVNDASEEPHSPSWKPVNPTSFSELYKALPEHLTPRMRSELSSPLAFIAILHLANEQTLKLTQIDNGNFRIEKDRQPTVRK